MVLMAKQEGVIGMEINKNNRNQSILKLLKEEIRRKQEELNRIIVEGKDKEQILKFSQELDILISKYLLIKTAE